MKILPHIMRGSELNTQIKDECFTRSAREKEDRVPVPRKPFILCRIMQILGSGRAEHGSSEPPNGRLSAGPLDRRSVYCFGNGLYSFLSPCPV